MKDQTQEESRPAEQCRVCEGSGRLVRTLERGEVSSDCGNCGGTGVLPARPAVEEGPGEEVLEQGRQFFKDWLNDVGVPYAEHEFVGADAVFDAIVERAARPLVQEDEETCFTCGHAEDDHGPVCETCYQAVGGLACAFFMERHADPRNEDDDVEAAHWAELYLDDCQADYDREGTDFPTPREAYIAGFKRAAIERRRGVAVPQAGCVDCSESALDAAFIRNLGEAEDMPPLEAGWPEMTAALDRIMARADKPAPAVQAGGGDEALANISHAANDALLAFLHLSTTHFNVLHGAREPEPVEAAWAECNEPFIRLQRVLNEPAQAGGGLCTRCGFEQRAEKPCACAVLDRARDAESRLAAIIDRIGNARLVPWVVDGEEYRQRADGTVVRALGATPQPQGANE